MYGGITLRGMTKNVSTHVGRTRLGGAGTAVSHYGYAGAGDGCIGAACHFHCREHGGGYRKSVVDIRGGAAALEDK